MKNNFQSKAVPRGTRTIWRYLSALFLLFTLGIGQMWGANTPASAGEYSLVGKKPGGENKFYKLGDGVYIHRKTNSSWDSSMGMKIPSTNDNGVAVYLSSSMKVSALINKKSDKNAVNVELKAYPITNGSTTFDALEAGTDNSTTVAVTIGSTASYTLSTSFAALSSKAAENKSTNEVTFVAGYYYIVGTDDKGTTYLTSVTLAAASATAPAITAPTTDQSASYTVGQTITALSVTATGTPDPTFQWYSNSSASTGGTAIEGATNASYTPSNTVASDLYYYCVATNSEGSATSPFFHVAVSAAAEVCPSGLTISGTASYTEGQTISLTAALSAGNGEITYTWYKGADLATAKAAGSIGTGASFSKASCATSDAGNYYCVASKDACPDAESTAYAVTVAEKVCPTSGVLYSAVVAATSNQSIAASTSDLALTASQATVVSGTMSVYNGQSSAKNLISQQNSKYYFTETNGNTFFRVRMDCALQAGDVITAEIYAGGSDTRGLWFATGTTYPSSAPTAQAQRTGPGKIEYVVAVGDGIIGEQDFSIFRATGNSTYFNNVVITRPYSVSYDNLKEAAHTMPAKAVEFTLEELTHASFDHTGWTADKLVKVGGETKAAGTALAVDATVELTDNTTFTATWEAKAATFAVTYKANNGTEEADINDPAASTFAANTFTVPDGKMFAGWNTKADGEGTNYTVGDAVTADITVYAKWVVDPTIRLILKSGDTYSINTDKFTVYEGTELQNEEYTVDGRVFAKNFKFGGTCSSTPFAGQAWSNKFMAYDVASNSTDIKLYVYNKNSGNKKLYYQIVPEGSAAAAFQSVTITSKATNQVVSIPTITAAKGARVLFGIESNDVRICQVEVLENGTALPAFGTNGYEFSVPGRAATYNKEGVFDGFEFKTNADLKFISGQDYIALRNIDGSQYVKFTVATNIQLQVTTPNANKFYVSKTAAGDAEKDTQYGGSAATHNVNLHAGTYYIAPTVGSSGGEVRITKLAFATAPEVKTVNFNSNEGSSVEAQEVFAGEKAVKPEDPTKDGYRFVEWQLSGSAYDFDDAVATDITLDAVWQKTWTVTFDSDGGSDVDPVTVDDGAKVTAPDPAPTKAGNDFDYWYKVTGETGQEDVAYIFSTMVGADMTLKAHWTPLDNDASISALSYDGNAIDLASGVEVAGVMTFNVLLPWGATPDKDLIFVTKSAESATVGTISYDSESKTASFTVTAGDLTTTADYAIVFANDVKKGTSIVKAVVAGGDQKAGFAATGIYGDKGYAYTRNNKKLDTADKFVGVKLLSGKTFAAGDKLFVVTSTAADMGYIELYNEAAGTNLIKATGVRDASAGIEIPSELVGLSEFYIVRKASTGDQAWNGFVDYVEVTREMNPAIKSFKFGDNAATINEAAKTISIDVPYLTDVTALTPTVEAYGNNGATYTPAGVTDFTSPVVYTVTDGYNEFHTDYTVTVNIAAPSENADLASLEVAGYPFDFYADVTSYSVVLDYGTTELPAITYEVEEVGLATAAIDKNGVSGATTITVTPQAGESYKKVYTINFSVSTQPKYVIYDGSKGMTAFSATSFEDEDTHFAWAIGSGITPSADNVPSTATYSNVWGGKTYTKMLKGFKPQNAATTQLTITVPENYLAKIRLVGTTNSNESMRKMFVSKEASRNAEDALDGYIIASDSYNALGLVTNYLLPGVYYIGSTDSYRLYELSIQLYPIDYSRNVTEGRYGTICLPNGGVIAGATIFEIAYMDYQDSKPYKIYFDEILGGVMEAGMPYIFLPKEGASQLAVTYTDAAAAEEGHHNGLYGKYTKTNLADNDGIYILKNNQYWYVNTTNVYCEANRAYIKLAEVPDFDPGKPAYGRRRVALGVNSENAAQGFENIENGDAPMKVMIDGNLYILRGEKVFDATGRLIK